MGLLFRGVRFSHIPLLPFEKSRFVGLLFSEERLFREIRYVSVGVVNSVELYASHLYKVNNIHSRRIGFLFSDILVLVLSKSAISQ